MPELEVQAFWVSLPDSPQVLKQVYEEHGTMEQFHSEIKTYLDLERLLRGSWPAMT